MDEIVRDFLVESNENLDRLDRELVRLESEPSSVELLSSIFRTIHTIKGSCGFLGFSRLEKLAHAGESLLSRLRDGLLTLTAEITSGLLAMVDAVRQMLGTIQATEHDGEEDYAPLIQLLASLQEEHPEHAPQAYAGPAQHQPAPPGRISLAAEPEQQELEQRHAMETAAQVAHPAAHFEDAPAAPQIVEARTAEAAVETIRVGVTLLDRLMNLVGELVLARNQLLQFSNSTQDAGLSGGFAAHESDCHRTAG